MSADVSVEGYGGAQPTCKVKHPARGKLKGLTHFALDDIVRGNLFDSPLPNSLADTCRSGTSQIIKQATYDGTSSWLDYKGHFEACAAENGWSEESIGMVLAVSLRGHAQSVLGTYQVIKAIITAHSSYHLRKDFPLQIKQISIVYS